jgi:hypothetical protein
MVLLGAMMLLLYSGLAFALRSWDAGDVNGRRVADWRIAENFLRREVSEVFPLRWKDPSFVKFAFEGERARLRRVRARRRCLRRRPAARGSRAGSRPRGPRDLVMRRAMASDDVNASGPLAAAGTTLPTAESAGFAYSAPRTIAPSRRGPTWTFTARSADDGAPAAPWLATGFPTS